MSATAFPFILDGFPRTGSTTLTRILNLHPDIECCMEPFHPRRYGGEFNRLCLESGSTAPALAIIQLRWNGLKHVWEPGTGWPFTGNPELNDDLVRRAVIVITLRRRNLLRQIVSGYISKRLGFWVGTAAEFNARLNSSYLPSISTSEAKIALAQIVAASRKRDELLGTLQVKRVDLVYEDIFEIDNATDKQISFCNWIFSELGHRKLEDDAFRAQCQQYFDPALYRWANNDVYARIPGSHLLDKVVGNDITGRLFE